MIRCINNVPYKFWISFEINDIEGFAQWLHFTTKAHRDEKEGKKSRISVAKQRQKVPIIVMQVR